MRKRTMRRCLRLRLHCAPARVERCHNWSGKTCQCRRTQKVLRRPAQPRRFLSIVYGKRLPVAAFLWLARYFVEMHDLRLLDAWLVAHGIREFLQDSCESTSK